MLVNQKYTNDQIWEAVTHELKSALHVKNHPFRFMVMGSTDGIEVSQRYVVMRDIDDDLNVYAFTDNRTLKVEQFKKNPNCSLLFYHTEKRLQIRINGVVELHQYAGLKDYYWKSVKGEAKKAYTPSNAPGEPIKEWEEAYQWDESLESRHFTVMKVIPAQIEVLQLHKLEHLRIRFSKLNYEWVGQKLIP